MTTHRRWLTISFATLLHVSLLFACGGPSVTVADTTLSGSEPTRVTSPVGEPPKPDSPSANTASANSVTQPAHPGPRSVSVDFRNIQPVRGCIYFSGPGRLGRNHELGTRALMRETEAGTQIIFGTQPPFLRAHGQSTFRRETTHTHGGKWTASEVMELRAANGGWVGTYQYEECEEGTSCPGSCTISADVQLQ